METIRCSTIKYSGSGGEAVWQLKLIRLIRLKKVMKEVNLINSYMLCSTAALMNGITGKLEIILSSSLTEDSLSRNLRIA